WGRNGRRGACVRVSVAAKARLRSSSGVTWLLMPPRSRARETSASGRKAIYDEDPAMHRVVAVAVPEVVAFDLSIPAQIFGHISERHRYRFTVCAQEPGLIDTTTGFALYANAPLDAVRSADTVIVPGFMPLHDPGPAVAAALRDAAERGARIASVCIGAFALAAAGLLDGRQATTHWEHAEELAVRYPAVRVNPGVLYVDEGQILTSAGVAAGIDLCLHMVRNDHGAAAAA